MQHHEKKAFLKFFLTYFFSVALLILVSGYFYFQQIYDQKLKAEEFSLIEYARHIKMNENLEEFKPELHHIFTKKLAKHIDIRNFTMQNGEFVKYLPAQSDGYYLVVYKPTKQFYDSLWQINIKIITLQFLLLTFFGILSYKLAKSALSPLQTSILTLDKFTKDLIHDLSTPVTSIQLNMKILQKDPHFQSNVALGRVNKSASMISELHENLTLLLHEETFLISEINVCIIVADVIAMQRQIYPNLKFINECNSCISRLNQHAIKQILQNIVSNACKYNTAEGFVKIYSKDKILYIQDNGKGIKEPEKIFERSYSGEHSSGIGLDIVKRLATAMNIKIHVHSDEKGTLFTLFLP
ncbi:MAG: HAMP domain-containing sensor histidine kinase [Thiovulaceae bacterium]|nr:HAMP domain-containing sensor histidine kinase [Sulfurimonadaceae bacterium]